MNNKRRDDLIDEASDESFPASDPPSYMGGAAVAGSPARDEAREPSSGELLKTDHDAPADERDATAKPEQRKLASKVVEGK